MHVLLIDINPFMAPTTPISLGYLGAVLQAAGHQVQVISLGLTSSFSVAGLSSYLQSFAPELVGFGTYQRNLLHVRAIARVVKQTLPGTRVVLGGPQAMFLPAAGLAAMPEVDYVARGEGELVIRSIADTVAGGEWQVPIPGATTRLPDGTCISGPPADPQGDLDSYPSPWLNDILDPAEMEESILLTSRGCPHHCTFCFTAAASGGRLRCHSVERVLDDIAHVASRGSGRLWFADPNFSFSKTSVTEILEGILRQDLSVKMWIETRADMLTPELISLMKRAGVHTVALGLESASANVYPRVSKDLEPQQVGEAARTALAAGLDVELFSQYALPGERFQDAMTTLQFVKDCGVKIRGNSNAQQMQLYFGSEITSCYAEHGLRPLRDQLPPYLSIGTEFETEWMSKEEIEQVKATWQAESLDGGQRIVS
jgi:radical SAM superfamily enzyme YgiQ (UPF0313 family)